MNSSWKVTGASIAGKGHIENNLPCQDAHAFAKINTRWIVAITSDGAGSYKNSELGSKFIVKDVIKELKSQMKSNKLFYKNNIPDEKEWRTFVIGVFKISAENLNAYSKRISLDYKSLSCTVNLALISDDMILTANIGDGRSCYKSINGNWNSMMFPFKGEEAGSTVFITTQWIWEDEDCINTQVIKDTPTAFALISDGMERYAFSCYIKDENDFYKDPNEPFSAFFETNIKSLRSLFDAGYNKEEIIEALSEYLAKGKNLVNELDDKTLLIGFKNDKN